MRFPARLALLLLPFALPGLFATTPTPRRDAEGRFVIDPPAASLVIRYTLDDKDPGRDAGAWLAPVSVPGGYTLKLRAFTAAGEPAGEVVSHVEPARGPRPASTVVPVTQNRDWRTYDWARRHEACVALLRDRQPEIVLIGDSITHFWGGDPADGRRTGVTVWDRLFAGRRVVNLGCGWDRTENVLWRLTHGEFDGVRPKVAVIMIGTNNLNLNPPEEIAAGVEAIIAEVVQRSPSTRILLLGLFPRGAKPDATRTKVAAVNQRLAHLDGSPGVTYLDVGPRFLAADGTITQEIMDDFLHPSAAGYALWAEAMGPTLERLLAAPAR
jgi:lysophospholipase L1-like esterase